MTKDMHGSQIHGCHVSKLPQETNKKMLTAVLGLISGIWTTQNSNIYFSFSFNVLYSEEEWKEKFPVTQDLWRSNKKDREAQWKKQRRLKDRVRKCYLLSPYVSRGFCWEESPAYAAGKKGLLTTSFLLRYLQGDPMQELQALGREKGMPHWDTQK
jgi:hypothetical protein